MCDDHDPDAHDAGEHSPGSGTLGPLSRRRLLQGLVAVGALTGLGRLPGSAAAPLPPRLPNAEGMSSFVLGMHLHASASEGIGSVRTQLAQAAAHGFDVAWFTEHDWRRRRLLFRSEYHFLPTDVVYGGNWTVPALPPVGSLTTASVGRLVSTPVSPKDPAAAKGSLRLRATSTGSGLATLRHRIAAEGSSRVNFRGRITGRTVSVDVLLSSSGPDAWGEVLFKLSRQVGSATRPAGQISMLYRLRSDITTKTLTRQGATGIVDVPVSRGRWQTLTVDLTRDVARAWPDLDARDNSLNEIEFHASSRRRAPADVFFGYLRFGELTGYDAVGVEHGLLASYAGAVPGVLGLVGTELSLGPHVNQYGGTQAPYDYGRVTSLTADLGDLRRSLSAFVHAHGGLASINHPFEPGDSPVAVTQQSVAASLLDTGAGGADILEVGYADRFGTLAQHLAVWDTLSRNGLFLTGNGVSDDHGGGNWAGLKNRFYTAAWSHTLSEKALLDSLARGRNYVGFLGGFGGTIDMAVDGAVPMGAVSVSPLTTRTLRIDVPGLPSGGGVRVVRGDVDRAGTRDPNPGTTVVRTLGASDLARSRLMSIDTSDDCFHRLEVLDSTGAVVGFGQPTWVLKAEPPNGIPPSRRVVA